MPAPLPFPEPIREHVEQPRPAVADDQVTEPVHKARHASPAASADPRPAAQQPSVPRMPDLRATGDDRSRNEFTTVYDILDGIESTLNEAKAGFFTPNVVKVDRDELSAQLEELKKMLPVQLERASALMREAERRLEGAQTQANAIVAAAQSRAADMIKEANDQAQFLSGQENVVALAQAKARATMETAQAKSDRLTNGADKYCVEVMQSLDQQLDKLKQDVNAGLNVLYARQQRAAQDYAAVQAAAQSDGVSGTDQEDQQ
ncbi:cell division protein [Bifidobacterium moraviense]